MSMFIPTYDRYITPSAQGQVRLLGSVPFLPWCYASFQSVPFYGGGPVFEEWPYPVSKRTRCATTFTLTGSLAEPTYYCIALLEFEGELFAFLRTGVWAYAGYEFPAAVSSRYDTGEVVPKSSYGKVYRLSDPEGAWVDDGFPTATGCSCVAACIHNDGNYAALHVATQTSIYRRTLSGYWEQVSALEMYDLASFQGELWGVGDRTLHRGAGDWVLYSGRTAATLAVCPTGGTEVRLRVGEGSLLVYTPGAGIAYQQTHYAHSPVLTVDCPGGIWDLRWTGGTWIVVGFDAGTSTTHHFYVWRMERLVGGVTNLLMANAETFLASQGDSLSSHGWGTPGDSSPVQPPLLMGMKGRYHLSEYEYGNPTFLPVFETLDSNTLALSEFCVSAVLGNAGISYLGTADGLILQWDPKSNSLMHITSMPEPTAVVGIALSGSTFYAANVSGSVYSSDNGFDWALLCKMPSGYVVQNLFALGGLVFVTGYNATTGNSLLRVIDDSGDYFDFVAEGLQLAESLGYGTSVYGFGEDASGRYLQFTVVSAHVADWTFADGSYARIDFTAHTLTLYDVVGPVSTTDTVSDDFTLTLDPATGVAVLTDAAGLAVRTFTYTDGGALLPTTALLAGLSVTASAADANGVYLWREDGVILRRTHAAVWSSLVTLPEAGRDLVASAGILICLGEADAYLLDLLTLTVDQHALVGTGGTRLLVLDSLQVVGFSTAGLELILPFPYGSSPRLWVSTAQTYNDEVTHVRILPNQSLVNMDLFSCLVRVDSEMFPGDAWYSYTPCLPYRDVRLPVAGTTVRVVAYTMDPTVEINGVALQAFAKR